MSPDATKKSPTAVTSEPQEIEEHKIRLRAYELYAERGRENRSRPRRLALRRRRNHAEEGTHHRRLIQAHTSTKQMRHAPDSIRGFFPRAKRRNLRRESRHQPAKQNPNHLRPMSPVVASRV
jgi:hypothetical protein